MARQPNTIHKAEAQSDKPELTLMPASDGRDPRLLALVCLLARRAARGLYEEQLKETTGRRTLDHCGGLTMRVAIYARYSSDSQREASIADQFRLCRLHAEKQGWIIVEEYSDHAISGASLLRPGVQALISDATRGLFDLVLA